MESKRISAQAPLSLDTQIVTPKFKPSNENVVFSFDALERNKYFNLDATCSNWASDLFIMLKSISGIKKATLMSHTYSTYRFHNHADAHLPCSLPAGVAKKDCYQMRISTAKGGIHGVFYENIFYVIWLDPLHNMYPNDHYGGLRIIKAPNTCCMERDKELDVLLEAARRLQDENDKLRKEIDEWEEIADKEFKKKTDC